MFDSLLIHFIRWKKMLKSCIQMLPCAEGDERTEKPRSRRSKGATGVWHAPLLLPSILPEEYPNVVEWSMCLGWRERKGWAVLAACSRLAEQLIARLVRLVWMYPWIIDWVSIKELKTLCWRSEWWQGAWPRIGAACSTCGDIWALCY